MLWFGLIFVGFVLFSPEGLVGVWARLSRRWRPVAEESAAMSRRRIYEGLPLPAFLRPPAPQGPVLEVAGVEQRFGGIRAVPEVALAGARSEERRSGKGCVRRCGLRWSTIHSKKKTKTTNMMSSTNK